jgi:GTP-binding protein HflX
VQVSALKRQGFDALMQKMEEAIQSLRKIVSLTIPQSHYVLVSQLMQEGRVMSVEYEENDVLMEVEIPTSLQKKVEPFIR